MRQSWLVIVVLVVLLLELAFFILLILRADHYIDVSAYIVDIPLYVLAVGGTILFFVVGVIGRSLGESLRLLCFGLAFLLAGSLGTEVLMSQRMEGDGRATYLATFTPFLVALIMAALAVMVALIIQTSERPRKQPTPLVVQLPPPRKNT